MKPYLSILQHNHISYRWGFPSALHFSYKDTTYTCKSVDVLITTIHDLCLKILQKDPNVKLHLAPLQANKMFQHFKPTLSTIKEAALPLHRQL